MQRSRSTRARLAAIAECVGPTVQEVLGDGHVVGVKLVEHFHKRAGFSRPADPVDLAALDLLFKSDLLGV